MPISDSISTLGNLSIPNAVLSPELPLAAHAQFTNLLPLATPYATSVCSTDDWRINHESSIPRRNRPLSLLTLSTALAHHPRISEPSSSPPKPSAILAGQKKKYKPVALKVRPIKTDLPSHFRIIRNITGDPLADMPRVDIANIPDFVPTGRYSQERMEAFDERHSGFLLPEERRLLHYFMMLNNSAFAWDDNERGRFKHEYFPPVSMAVVPHIPWVERNIPIPRGLYDEICSIVRAKIAAGVCEPSNASYRSKWFCVLKADGKSLRPVHSLEELNRVTIQHSGVPPIPDELAETFGGRVCGAVLDLFVGYDNRDLDEASRDYTTFHTPYGLMRLTKLPMGWTNLLEYRGGGSEVVVER